jgi:hypothetical protein
MGAIRAELYLVLAKDHPMTVRQVFYQLTSRGVIDKTEAEYKGTVCRLAAEMRRSGVIPYGWLVDSTRWQRRPRTFSSVEAALRRTAETYRRALWDESDVAVELWLEKEALAGVLVDVTSQWDVPLMVTRGYPSMSYTHSAAESIHARAEAGQHTYIYYFGDRDPTGVDIDRAVRENIGESLSRLMGDGYIGFDFWATFHRVAVTEEQIATWDLPSRPTKKSDTRSRGFTGESVELDAIPAQDLRELAAETIRFHVDPHQLKVLEKAEAEERRLLLEIAQNFNNPREEE